MNVFSELALQHMSEFKQSLLGMRCVMRPGCPTCRSMNGQWRGFVKRKEDNAILHRRWCKQCGRWFYGEAYLDDRASVVVSEQGGVLARTVGITPVVASCREARSGRIESEAIGGASR